MVTEQHPGCGDAGTVLRTRDIDSLAEPLKKILEAEIAQGNQVQEVSSWPPRCQLLVILRRPFKRPYDLGEDLEYAAINDSHYWESEYRFRDGLQILACKADASR